jgi:two-component system, LytTR family, sensor kinase
MIDKCRIEGEGQTKPLEMKAKCERCRQALATTGEAYICSYDCTFCPACVADMNGACRNCGGELSRRPQRKISISHARNNPFALPAGTNRRAIWMWTFIVWAVMTLAACVSIYQYDRAVGTPMQFLQEIPLELSENFTFAPLTPFVLALALRFPFKKKDWLRPLLILLGGAAIFTFAHSVLRATTYPVWDRAEHRFVSIWIVHGHTLGVRWDLIRGLFTLNWFNDITSVYIPVVVVAYTVSSYQKLREREFRNSQLEIQLAKAHLESLKNQLRPHFLFNTMHSISALMHTDVGAADKMMCRLSDLLRMSLEDVSLQMTTLSRELEFVGSYLEIEKLRFEERLNVQLDIAGDTYDAEIPHLILQPLVENAVRHGIAKRSGQGELRIEATHDESNLLLRITDNGPGLAGSDVSSSKSSLGLRSTRERLQTLYGTDQAFSIRDLEEGGVEVSLRIPFRVEARPSIHEAAPGVPEPRFGT